jgi:ABC-type transport system involved in multi-copper enzyme maturation permease subunit
MLLASRSYLLAGIVTSAVLALVTVMLYVGSTDDVIEERGPLGESATLEIIGSSDGLALAVGSTISMVGLVMMAVHASVIASDYSTGMIRNLVVRQPDRLRLLVGKVVALAFATLLVTLVVVATSTVAAVAFAPPEVDTSRWFTNEGLLALLAGGANYFLAALGWGVFGQVIAVLARSAIVALAIGVMVAIPIDLALTDTVERARPWLPGQLLQAVARGGTTTLEYGPSVVTVLAASVLGLGVSILVFRSRDIVS